MLCVDIWERVIDPHTTPHKFSACSRRVGLFCDGHVSFRLQWLPWLRRCANYSWVAPSNLQQPLQQPPRHIVFIGEAGTGKSSVINLILGENRARVNNNVEPCTTEIGPYNVNIQNQAFVLWDTPGFDGGPLRFLRLSEKKLKRFLRTQYEDHQLHLLVHCVQGRRATSYMERCYNTFCAATRRVACPVVVVVTGLERQKPMESWWVKNGHRLANQGMVYDGHACISCAPNADASLSLDGIIDLIRCDYNHWRAEANRDQYMVDSGCIIA